MYKLLVKVSAAVGVCMVVLVFVMILSGATIPSVAYIDFHKGISGNFVAGIVDVKRAVSVRANRWCLVRRYFGSDERFTVCVQNQQHGTFLYTIHSSNQNEAFLVVFRTVKGRVSDIEMLPSYFQVRVINVLNAES